LNVTHKQYDREYNIMKDFIILYSSNAVIRRIITDPEPDGSVRGLTALSWESGLCDPGEKTWSAITVNLLATFPS
jgi:hypothetical protein